ncbi:MAG TPA: hypothetical protein VGH46_03435 [Gaiellaceae bacterium]
MNSAAARFATLAVLGALVLGVTAAAGASASPARAPISGVVWHAGATPNKAELHRTVTAGAIGENDIALQRSPCTPPLCWVMRTNRTYAIYWVPSGQTVQAGYEDAINQYLTDVAAASGSQSIVYSVATQYYDSTGYISTQSTFGGAYVDTDPFPASGCQATPTCLTDSQLQTEIQKVITANGWTDGPDSLFFILTPEGVGSCLNNSGAECSTNFFCAYHSGFTGTDGKPVLYANEPYDATVDQCSSPSPNNDDADSEINTMSHEHNEAITDPWGNGWLDSSGDEIADICAWNFGTPLGTAADGQPYNQLINGHEYELQQDYSNDGSTCRQRYVGLPANTSLPIVSGAAVENQTLSAAQGSWTQVPTGYAYQWLLCGANGTGCQAVSGATSATYTTVAASDGHTLEIRISATNSSGTTTAVSRPTSIVVGMPAIAKAPHITGRARVGRQLVAGHGSWRGSPQTFQFQWLRCNASGGSCVHISRATHPKYRVTKRDARHRLRVVITAANVAGSETATSRSTARVATKS